MSTITNDDLTRSGTGYFLYSCTHMTTVGVQRVRCVVYSITCYSAVEYCRPSLA